MQWTGGRWCSYANCLQVYCSLHPVKGLKGDMLGSLLEARPPSMQCPFM